MPPLEAALRGREGDRLHRPVDQHLARRRVHPDPADGRHRRPALPRVRGHALGRDRRLAGRLADDDADDVRAAPQAHRRTRRTAGSSRRASGSSTAILALLRDDRSPGCCATSRSRSRSRSRRWRRRSSSTSSVPKGFFPQQDTGRLTGIDPGRPGHVVPGDAAASSREFVDDRHAGPGRRERDRLPRRRRRTNTGRMFVVAEAAERAQADAPTRSSRGCAASSRTSPGANLVLQPVQDLRIGGRPSARAVPVHAAGRRPRRSCSQWAPKVLRRRCASCPSSTDVNSDQQNKGLQAALVDRPRRPPRGSASRRRRSTTRSTTRSASGRSRRCTRRSTSTTSSWRSTPQFWQNPDGLEVHLRARRPTATLGPARPPSRSYEPSTAPLAVNHQGQFPSVTISFNLPPGVALGDAVDAIERAEARDAAAGRRSSGSFQGTAQAFQASLANEPILIARGAARGLHRARHPLREPDPPDHDPLDAALGGRRRAARAAPLPATTSP